MEGIYILKHPGVKKTILHGGKGPLPHFPSGTKLIFHFQTLLDNFERTVIDDSRKNKHPTEIFVGKMFKMEVWEVLLTSMRLGEVAEFWCDAIHTGLYPLVSKGIRLAAQGKDPLEGQKHMCGMGNMFTYHSTGFPDLDELMREPLPLIFIMELISVGDPLSYARESWLMDKDEKMQAVPSLHQRGNALVRQRRYAEAAAAYQEAVLLLRTVQSREMPGDEDYINLSKLIIPLVLNYCQCKLELEEYYEVIEHTSELIDKHKDCVKAYYKRAKAYTAVWSEREARRDFQTVAKLDATLARLVQKELHLLSEQMREKYCEDKERYWKKLEEKEKTTAKVEARAENEACGVTERGQVEDPNNSQCPQGEADSSAEGGEGWRDILPTAAPTEGKDWQQMLRLIMLLQDEGIFCIKEQRFADAAVKFKEALEYVNHLQSKVSMLMEKEVDYKGEDWESLEKVRLPLTLNLSQCRLELGQFHQVIGLNSEILRVHKDNLKAVYQRARAHAALCNQTEAREDFCRVAHLDATLKPIMKQELRKLGESIRAKHVRDQKNYWSNSRERRGKKASAKNANGTGREEDVKLAAESRAGGGGGEVDAAQAEGNGAGMGSSGRGEERSLSQPGSEERQNARTSSLNEKQVSSLVLREERAELGQEPREEERDSDRAEVARDNPSGLDTGRKVNDVSRATASEETSKNESDTQNAGQPESQEGAL